MLNRARLFGRAVVVVLCFQVVVDSATGANIEIDSDSLKFRVNGFEVDYWQGSQISATFVDGVARFKFHGNLYFDGDMVLGIGSRPISLLVGDSAFIVNGTVIDMSAMGINPGPGGGSGGIPSNIVGVGAATSTSGQAALGGLGGNGGFASCPQLGVCNTITGQDGNPGASGYTLSGNAGGTGAAGSAGGSGFGLPASGGGGGSGGSGGVAGAGGLSGSDFTCAFVSSGLPGCGGRGGLGTDLRSFGTLQGYPGNAGFPGLNGGNGSTPTSPGAAGSAGAPGTNNGTGLQISGGGGGGSGGNGGGGGSGGPGAGGGGGGGGGGGAASYIDFAAIPLQGGSGGNGGAGGRGGNGGAGGNGGRGGTGGGGGGALEIIAYGNIYVEGMLRARGGSGGNGQSGAGGMPGTSGFDGSPGTFGGNGQFIENFNPSGGYGGAGRPGGTGGVGGTGASGGKGGNGGGGAGGTIKLVGSIVNGADAMIDTSGGAGAANGRVLIGQNTVDSFTGELVGARLETFAGTRRQNPFIKGGRYFTPIVPDLNVAEAFGVVYATVNGELDEQLQDVVSSAPAGATMALTLVDEVYSGEGILAGHDLLLMLNLRETPLVAPRLGVDLAGQDADFLVELLAGGYKNDPIFGGAGPLTLPSLSAYSIYGIAVPESVAAIFNAASEQASLTGISLQLGEAVYATSATLPGDYNGNGTVDAADYTVWRNNVGAAPGTLPNDIDGGLIGPAQYTTWKANFGNALAGIGSGGSASSNIAVPEPASALLLLAALTILAGSRRRRLCL